MQKCIIWLCVAAGGIKAGQEGEDPLNAKRDWSSQSGGHKHHYSDRTVWVVDELLENMNNLGMNKIKVGRPVA